MSKVFARSTRHVASSDDVSVVVYDEAATAAPNPASRSAVAKLPLPALLFSHATGFHGRVFAPVASHLPEFDRTTFDYRGYGDTTPPRNWSLTWQGFGDDALAVARAVATTAGRPVVGVGHSMGGAGLIMAALREPQHFAGLIVFEPIIFPPEARTQSARANPLAEVTRRRRRSFPAYAEAIANFAAKPPLSSLHPDALAAYVHHGFVQRNDGVELKCDPEFEAQTYEMGAFHDTWQRLGELRTPTWVMAGALAEMSPAAIAPRVAERIPDCTFVEWRDLGHFGPLDAPERFADFVREIATGISAR
ncbi:MAG: alpha/beta hydrolase [Actinobacteria bacterium]|nr:alpha/beta hydrolase [Actinomycetota bacterium]